MQKNIPPNKLISDVHRVETVPKSSGLRLWKINKRFIIIVCVLIAIFLTATVWFLNNRKSIIPGYISTSVSFPIFYPNASKTIKIDPTTFKYSKSLGQVSFIISFSGSKITFAEQSSPDSFAADPNFLTAFVQKLNDYATFTSINGRVDLVLPSETHLQTGVMNAKGTLVFASSSKNLTENSWKILFNSFNYTQP